MSLIDGQAVADAMYAGMRADISQMTGRRPGLAVVLVGEDPASQAYVRMKKRRCQEVGMLSIDVDLPALTSEKELLAVLDHLNKDSNVDGILVQLPLPSPLNADTITAAIDPTKDVDGLHPQNMGKLLLGRDDGFLPCTPHGVRVLLQRSGVAIPGKHVVIVGRSNIVGKPLAALLLHKGVDATVTVAHSKTRDLTEVCLSADILVAAIGQPHFITADKVRSGAVVIDVGVNRVEDSTAPRGYRLVGDVDFEQVQKKASLITPVPGGVGPMTIAMLLHNTLLSYRRRVL